MFGVLMRRGETCRQSEGRRHRKAKAEIGAIQLPGKECQEPPETGGEGRVCPAAFISGF